MTNYHILKHPHNGSYEVAITKMCECDIKIQPHPKTHNSEAQIEKLPSSWLEKFGGGGGKNT